MNRPIKFRAWNEATNSMEGWEEIKEGYTFGIVDYTEECRYLIFQQYTGLKDKNGKEIYEGDVVRILYTDWISKGDNDPRSLEEYKKDLSSIGVVVFVKGGFTLAFGDYHSSIFEGRHGEKEVIGNIYENPELI